MNGETIMHPRRGMGFPGGWSRGAWGREDVPGTDDLEGWLAGRLPDDWFDGTPDVSVDANEILVVGRIAAPPVEGGDAAGRAAAESGRIKRFREDTREQRMQVAHEAEHRYGRK